MLRHGRLSRYQQSNSNRADNTGPTENAMHEVESHVWGRAKTKMSGRPGASLTHVPYHPPYRRQGQQSAQNSPLKWGVGAIGLTKVTILTYGFVTLPTKMEVAE